MLAAAKRLKPEEKLLERSRQAGEFKNTRGNQPTAGAMWDGEGGLKEEEERSATQGAPQDLQEAHPMEVADGRNVQDMSVELTGRGNTEEDGEEEEDEDEEEDMNYVEEVSAMQQQQQTSQLPQVITSLASKQAAQSQPQLPSPAGREPDPDLDLDLDPDPDGDPEADPHGESYPCQHCERRFSTRQGLERHVHIHAISHQQAQLFKCRYCSKSFGSQVGRRRHERRHESGPKKKPGSLAGTAGLLGPLAPADTSSPDCTSPTSHYIAIGPQFTGGPLHATDVQRRESGSHGDRPFVLDENGESKELHPCKYCNKAFGTHTNMRRHQRRIHERHLLPKGVRRKGMLLPEASAPQQPDQSPSASPPPVYVPSADTEDEADRDDYAIDISKNISENLSFYIDGKIVSSSTVSTCEVIEVDSRSAALFGLDTVIISPNQISQALKVEGRTVGVKQQQQQQQQVSNACQPPVKRRTSTPPLVPSLKVETEPSSFSASSSSTSSSTTPSSNLLVGGLFQQAADSSSFQREKTVYLSPKLKQLLQTQDIQKSAITLLTESHRLASPLSVTPLQGAAGRFKRRTASPPSSSSPQQLSPAPRAESAKAEAPSVYALKVPKLESHSVSPSGGLVDREEGDAVANSGSGNGGGGGNSCNQQPLDLSSTLSRRSDTSGKILGDSALDLSLHRKSCAEPEAKGAAAAVPQLLSKKRKPNTSMLEKVLMNEYVGLPLAGDDGPPGLATLSCFHSRSPTVASDSAHPSPPSLTPVTLNPSSPGASSATSPTPPPPVLPTIPSPPRALGSPLSQPSDSSALPVLSPKMSPRRDSEELLLTEEDKDEEEEEEGEEEEEEIHVSEPMDSLNTPLKDSLYRATPSPPQPTPEESLTKQLPPTCTALLNGSRNQELDSEAEKPVNSDFAALSPPPGSPPPSKSPHPVATPRHPSPAPPQIPESLRHIQIKEEPPHCTDELPVTNHTPQNNGASSPQRATPEQPPDKPSEGEDAAYSKTFVCNVCEEPFGSMKELGGHITEHAADWPYKCEFCVQLFGDADALLGHRTSLHGVGRIFVCSACSKEFAFLCNLQQHQKDLHPNEACTHTSVESGKLRPQNYTDPTRAKEESSPPTPAPADTCDEPAPQDSTEPAKEEADVNGNHTEEGGEDPNEELYTTIKIMASEGGKPKGPDVRLGINQHYPSYKPPPFPYHSRSHASSVASATNFTTHNIPQTFTTAIRCTKCGNSFDNMPELHKHILACANASDKKRYTPKKNPIPLKQIVKCPNGVVSPTAANATAANAAAAAAAGQNAFRRMGQPKRLNFNQDVGKTKMSALMSKKKNQLVQRAISQRNKAATSAKKAGIKSEEEQTNVCPHCNREFTYQASLNKHMAVSCPLKPAAKKGKRGQVEVKKEKNLRRKALDAEASHGEAGPRPLGKTRARSSGAADPEPPQTGRGKAALKRSTSFTQLPASKKSKKAVAQTLPPAAATPDAPSEAGAGAAPPGRPAMRMQRMGKEAAPKRLAEAKSPPATLQVKKEERFSLRNRERVGGPVTRSLQSAAPPADAKPEEPSATDTKDTQEALTK